MELGGAGWAWVGLSGGETVGGWGWVGQLDLVVSSDFNGLVAHGGTRVDFCEVKWDSHPHDYKVTCKFGVLGRLEKVATKVTCSK